MLISPFIAREILVDERFRIGAPAASSSWVNSSFFCSETLVTSAFLNARPTFASIAFVTVEAVVVGAGAFVAGLRAAEVFVAAGFLAVSGIRYHFGYLSEKHAPEYKLCVKCAIIFPHAFATLNPTSVRSDIPCGFLLCQGGKH
jgi:hypothetical protein